MRMLSRTNLTDEVIRYRECDQKFRAAMVRALVLGREKFTQGVFKDDRPFVGKIVRPEPFYSGCSSAAALCAEMGSVEEESVGKLVFV